MKIKYLGKYEGEDLRPCSFWCEPIRYDFEIIWDDELEDIIIFEKEFRLNCNEQL